MLKFPKSVLLATAAIAFTGGSALASGDIDAGEKVFKKCMACHMVGDGAKHRVGPELNDVFGRVAGSLDDFKYSPAMKDAGAGGLVWNAETIATYLHKPKDMIPKTKMAFGGLKKEKDIENLLAYLASFSAGADMGTAEPEAAPAAEETAAAEPSASAVQNANYEPSNGPMGLGRVAQPEEIAAWDIDIRPDGMGLPAGKGTVADGEVVFTERCATCHGDFGEGRDRWPVLAGGQDTLTDERPEKTIGSYWPYLSTVYDYVRRAMPFGDARSLTNDEVYAITAYLLYLNDIVTDEDFELNSENFTDIHLPNEENFIADDRQEEPHWKADADPCMTDCKAEPAKITMRARVLDVTPDSDEGEGGGQVD